MKQQLELADVDGVTLLMLAAASASVAVFSAVAKEIRPDQVIPWSPPAEGTNSRHFALPTMNGNSPQHEM